VGTEGRRSVSIFSTTAEVCLHALVVVIPFSLGGAAPWVLWPLVLLSTAALVCAVIGARRQRQDLLFAPAAAVPLVLALACALQLIPLPDGLLKVLSAPAAELKAFALAPLGLDRARPITLDATSTWRELAKSLSYLFTVAAAVQLSRSRTVRRRLLAAVALCGAAMALVGLGHKLFEVEKLFGFHAWTYAGPRLITPFANHNHLAGFLTLTSTVALGLAVTARERSRALLWALCFVAGGAAVALSISRGGMMSFVVAALVFAALLLRQRVARKAETGRGWLWTAVPLAALLATLGVGGLIALETASERLASVSTLERIGRTKVELWPMFAKGAEPFSLLGMGRGAFEVGFTPYQTTLSGVMFTHPENVALQLWAELGVPFALAVAVLGALALLRVLRRSDSHGLELAAVAGVAGAVLHDVFDFALEFPATAVVAAVVIGAASRGEKDEGLRFPVQAALPVGAVLAFLAVLSVVFSRPDFHEAEARLSALVTKRGDPHAVNALAKELVDRHPADYALYALAARAHSRRDGDPQEALAWVNRVLTLHPLDHGAHVDAARALLKLGKRGQALLEYRLAHEAGSSVALSEGLKYARTSDEALQLVDIAPAPVLVLCQALYAAGRVADGDAVLVKSLAEFGARKDAAPLWLLRSERLGGAGNARGALEALAEAEQRGADSLGTAKARSYVFQRAGQVDEALAVLQAQVAGHPEDVELAFGIANLLQGQGRTRQAREALTRVSPFVTEPATRARMMMAEAGYFEAENAPARAISAYQSAARLMPGYSSPHYQAARLYEALGKFDAAAREVHEGIRIDGPEAAKAQAAWLERLEQAQQKQVEP
jgi:tetratricopeptide (TPR) repeat protein